mgnify:CR=1 FL=1
MCKIDRVIEREYADAYRENLIVLDATTGQNALSQLREFNDVTNITGIILTKMDGTATVSYTHLTLPTILRV